MNETPPSTVVEHPHAPLSLPKYIVGFVSSIGLTLVAYTLATHPSYSKDVVVGTLAVLAVVQFVVQMVFFLHIAGEHQPRWKLAVMAWMLAVVLILVGGSVWIMNNLNTRMSPVQVQQYMKSQDSL